MGAKLKDLTGNVYGRLTVLRRGDYDRWGNILWVCRCECGTNKSINGGSLRSGNSQSCGCLNKELTSDRNIKLKITTHNQYQTRLYRIYTHMKHRCANPKCDHYHRYGGRGIKVCDEWQNFSKFATWARANGYQENLTIDRINNDGNYEPNNCQWLTRSDNGKKRWSDL